MIYVREKVGIFRCQVRTHPPSDGLHFIVMDANLWPNKGPAPELTWSQIFGNEHEFVSMPEDFNMQDSQPPYSSFWRSPATAQNQTVQLRDFGIFFLIGKERDLLMRNKKLYNNKLSNSVILSLDRGSYIYLFNFFHSVLEAVHEIQGTRIVDSDLEGQTHATHDDDQLVAQYQPVLGATFEDLFNTCHYLPSGPAGEFTRPTNSNDFGLEDQDDHLFTGRPNQQLSLSEELSWSPEKNLAELNLPFVTEGPAVQTSQLPYSAPLEISHAFIILSILSIIWYISKPESPNPKLPTSSEEFYCENNTLVAQGLLFPGGNIDNLSNRNKPFPSEKEYLVEPPEKLTWIGNFGFLAQEPWPGGLEQLPGDGKIYRTEHTINCRTS
ncbi:hypothetical protein LOK49_LG05G01276 [Camellia lanceoleosa]|uniref:Uncharacterized protein n=1 Tax=Camellia lanceoleosa TaxID=1840588 RepID=A0ACC0HW07_9ERIC|nr:hypothetical protein LOK49_LG05G01276 [Camellia lanceoleosa]